MSTLAVTVALAKTVCQIEDDSQDDLIELYIEGAQEFLAAYLNVYLYESSSQVVEHLDGGGERLWPTKRPVLTITKIEDHESDDAVLDEDYKLIWQRYIVRETEGATWAKGVQRWKVTYTAGYDLADMPAWAKAEILQLVSRAYWGTGGREHQSAAGYGFDFAKLMDSDMIARLRPHRMRVDIG